MFVQGSCGQSEFRNSELEIERVRHLEEISALQTRLQEAQEGAKINATMRAGLEQEFQDSVREVERLRAEIQVKNYCISRDRVENNAFVSHLRF